MSEVWDSLGDTFDTKASRSLPWMSGKETNKDWRLLDLARNVCRRFSNSDKRRWKSGASRYPYLRALGLCKSFA